jgi:DNA repair exonuclease SbcCD ATPase subunit
MSTEDIRIKLQADESGAVNSFRKLRSEVLNNEQGLKQLGQQGKMTGKGLKDMASFLGPEFQILGDRLDHVSGAMADIKGAGLLAKGAMIGLVATAGFQVGKMIGDWVFETEKWKETLADARKEADALNAKMLQGARERTSELSVEQLERELSGTSQNIGEITDQINKLKREAEEWSLSNTLRIGTEDRQNEIGTLEQEREAARKLRDMYQETLAAREKQAQAAREAEEAKALAEEARAAEQAAAAAQRLVETQEDYLFTLEAELVKIKEGEEAYTRLTLAKRGFTEESINSALALKAEISELTEAAKARERSGTSGSGGGMSVTAPGQVQGTQARFITRGIGTSGQDKILEATKEQIKKQTEGVVVQKAILAALAKIQTL